MPAVNRPPRYCRQKCKNRADRAYVEIDGRRVWLGTYGTEDSFDRYAEVIGKDPPSHQPKAESAPSEPTMAVLMVEYLKHAVEKYGGEKSSEVTHLRGALKILRRTHGEALAKTFGPKAFQIMRRGMIDAGWCRRYIRDQCQRIKRMVAWGIAEELLPANARHALDAVPGLTMGEFGVRETDEVEPVADDIVEQTLPHMSQLAADICRVIRLTACRPGEACDLFRRNNRR